MLINYNPVSNECKLLLFVAWRNGSALVSINEVNLRWARLVLGWLTVSGFNLSISVFNQPPRSTQPGHPFVGRRNEYTSKRAVTSCGWAGMVLVRMWVANTVELVITYPLLHWGYILYFTVSLIDGNSATYVASMTTPTPWGVIVSVRACAICFVNRSCTDNIRKPYNHNLTKHYYV